MKNRYVKFFKKDSIIFVKVDRYIAEIARDLVWDHKIRPKDAIHVATAFKSKIPILYTFDNDLIKLNNQIGEDPILRITIPDIPFQESFLDKEENEAQNKDSVQE